MTEKNFEGSRQSPAAAAAAKVDKEELDQVHDRRKHHLCGNCGKKDNCGDLPGSKECMFEGHAKLVGRPNDISDMLKEEGEKLTKQLEEK